MKKYIIIFCSISLAAIIYFSSCKKAITSRADIGYNYFPNQVGQYVIYDVDSVSYDDFRINTYTHLAKVDSFKFQLKEKIQSIFNDNQNRPTIRLERYVKYYNDSLFYNQMPWTLRNVWTENRTITTAEKVEENIRYIKLTFPIAENKTWNGNAKNTYKEWDYFYSFIDKPRIIGIWSFDSVLQVTQYNNGSPNIIEKQLYTEQYAKKVGLIYKQVIDIKSQPPLIWANLKLYPYGQDSTELFYSIPILKRITKGTISTMTVSSYGIE